jgi:hypothetical protein
MAREELKWQNIDADDLPAEVKKSLDAMVEAEAAFKADLEKLLKNDGSYGGGGEGGGSAQQRPSALATKRFVSAGSSRERLSQATSNEKLKV